MILIASSLNTVGKTVGLTQMGECLWGRLCGKLKKTLLKNTVRHFILAPLLKD